MVARGPVIQPVSRQSGAVGFSVRQVTVDEVVLSKGLAICKETTTGLRQDVPILPIRVGRVPQSGDVWIIDRQYGNWSFAALVSTMGTPATPVAAGPLDPPSYAGERTGVWLASKSLYNAQPDAMLPIWTKMAQGRRGASTLITCIGDSETEGNYLGTTTNRWSWPHQMRSMLGMSSIGTVWFGNHSTDDRWTKSAGTVLGGFALGAKMTNNGDWIQFASDEAGTVVEVIYPDGVAFGGTNQPFTIEIDGGAPVTVTPAHTNVNLTRTFSGLSNTVHTVKVTATGTSSFIVGIRISSGATAGVEVMGAGFSGTKAADWADTTWGFLSIWGQSVYRTPSIMVISLGINDAGVPLTIDSYKASMNALITNVKTKTNAAMLVAQPPSNLLTNWEDFLAAQYDLADDNNLPLVDLTHRFVSWARASSIGLYGDVTHPNDKGYNLIARTVATALTSDATV